MDRPSMSSPRGPLKWERPSEGWLKMNLNAAIDSNGGLIGSGSMI